MAEVKTIFFHFPNHIEESLEMNLSAPAPLVGETGNETELHLALDEETFDMLYETYKEHAQVLRERDANGETDSVVQEEVE